MLVLSRKLNETIVINGDIQVTVVAIHGNQVRLGIQAPASVVIVREELRDRVGARGLRAEAASAGSTGRLVSHGSVEPAQRPRTSRIC